MANMVASGGSSTINGVVYQLLRSLLHVAKVRVADPLTQVTSECITIVLEPLGGGGDLQLKKNGKLVVEQIKARSDGGTWSLRECIEDVLPDLFLAVVSDTSNAATFRFVTEGRMGAWRKVYDSFFQQIRDRGSFDDPLAGLDDNANLIFSRRTGNEEPFYPEICTELGLFLKIAEVIAERPAVKRLNLSDSDLHRRVRVLLGNFQFVGGQDIQLVQQSIDALLLAIVDKQDDIPSIRDHLAMELAKASTVGGLEIEPNKFLSQHGIDATPLTDWVAHVEKAKLLVCRYIARNRYSAPFDVRLDRLPDAPLPGKVLVLTGDSGTGKTWTLNALAERATGPLLPILIESEGAAEASLQKCAELFWNDIHDGDEILPLSRVANRLKKLTKGPAHTGVTIFVDSVRSYEEARRLVEQDWEAWSSSLVLVCRLEHANSLQGAYSNRVQIYECRDFTWEELHDYLGRRLETGWAEIPSDVRETLRRPLLAGIYCDEFGESRWESPSEYELYQRVWDRLSTGHQSDWPLDVGCVEALARKVRNGSSYPWSRNQLLDAGIANDGLIRLQRIGWFVATGDRYRVFHDRLLQWAIARSLCNDLRDGNITAESMVVFLTEQFRGASTQQRVFLGYVPMDVLWMMNQNEVRRLDVSVRLLESLENIDPQFTTILYGKLVPTVGRCLVDAVYNRLCSYDGYPWILKGITECVVLLGADRIEEFARPLITSDDGRKQRRGVNLLGLAACPQLLDQLWKIHIAGQFNPTAFGEVKEHSRVLYQETFSALKRSVREAPDWLHKAIEQADLGTDQVHDLGFLVANLSDGGTTWRAIKPRLFEKTAASRPRSLVLNIARYRDSSELDWLRQWIGSDIDHVASSALKALSRLDPDAAVAALPRMDPLRLSMSRKGAFDEIFERRSAETHAAILESMRTTDDPWKIALVFQDRENDVSTAQLEVLLDALCKTMDAKLKGESDPRRGLYLELIFIAKLAAPEHLQVLRARRGTALETMLRDYVLSIGPQIGQFSTGLERNPALAILNLIGGQGLTVVANEFLIKGDQYGKHEAIEWASKRPDTVTFERLVDIVQSDDCWPGMDDNPFPVNQNAAMNVLAWHKRWESVAEGIKKWGLKTSPDLKDCPERILDPWVDVLRQAVESTPTPGNILALGTVGGADDCPRIHMILDQCDLDSELAHACIIALEDLHDRSDAGVVRVAKHLSIVSQRYSTTRMLQYAGTPRAWDTLFEDLKNHFNFVTALNLINLSAHAHEVAEISLSQIATHRGMDGHSLLKLFLTEIRSQTIREHILNDQRVRELFHQTSAAVEGNFWFVGSKANAIECMAEFAPNAAFAAGCQVLTDANAHDRERYPSLLKKINRDVGIEWLVDHYPKEKSQWVRVAIGRTLEDEIPIATVLDKLGAVEETRRIGAADLAGWAALDDSIDVALTKALDDQSEDVIRAAIVARQRRRDRRTVVALKSLIVEETHPVERSIYLDALIGFVDPGDDHRPLHAAIQQALQAVPKFEAKEAVEKLKKRRKSLHDELKNKK
jgi:hypothetical protein